MLSKTAFPSAQHVVSTADDCLFLYCMPQRGTYRGGQVTSQLFSSVLEGASQRGCCGREHPIARRVLHRAQSPSARKQPPVDRRSMIMQRRSYSVD